MPAATVVAEAADAVEAGLWVDALEQAGINARVFEQSLGGAMVGASVDPSGAAMCTVSVSGLTTTHPA